MDDIVPKEFLEEMKKFPLEVQKKAITEYKEVIFLNKKTKNKQEDKEKIAEIYKNLDIEIKKE